jgi:hypothetical protein
MQFMVLPQISQTGCDEIITTFAWAFSGNARPSPRRNRVPPWEVFLWGHQADAQTGGHALTEEASIEGRFR